MVPGEESEEIIDNPTADNGVKCHQSNIANQTDDTENPPFVAGLFKLLIHVERTCPGPTPDGKFHRHDRQTENEQADQIDQHKAATPVLSAHPRKFPYIAAADGTSCRDHDKSETAAELFPFFHCC